jgi:hypothetical protein
MSITTSIASGGFLSNANKPLMQPFVELVINLPDLYAAGNLTIFGNVRGVAPLNDSLDSGHLLAVANVAAVIALPAVPGSGSTYWNVQIDPYTGTASIYTSSAADPVAQPCAGANSSQNQLIVARQTLPTGSVIPWLVGLAVVDFNPS